MTQSKTEQHTNLLISLDSLMDLRLGALTVLDPQFAFEVSTSEDYYTREEDSFQTATHGRLSKETLAKIMQVKQEEILVNSVRTRLIEFIDKSLTKLTLQSLATPYNYTPTLTINTYPYTLSVQEQNAMREEVLKKLVDKHPVSFVHLSPQELTPELVVANYQALFFYHAHPWMNAHDEAIRSKALSTVTVYAPHLYIGRRLTAQEKATFEEGGLSAASLLRAALAPFINYQDLPVALFSAWTPYNLDQYCLPSE